MTTKFTRDEKLIDKIFRSPFFEDLEEISNGAFEVRQRKRKVTITRPFQCGIAVYQLAKLRMLEFYYDFLDKFCDRRDFELIQMDTDSFYMALSAEDFDDIIKPEMKELYKEEKKKWLVTDEYSKRFPGLFKPEFKGKRMIALTSKCYFADNGASQEGIPKFSCKGVSRRHNEMNWERYKKALFGSLDKVTNIGFRKRDNHIVTYEQSKLGLSAYYDKRVVYEDGIHTSCLRAQSFAPALELRSESKILKALARNRRFGVFDQNKPAITCSRAGHVGFQTDSVLLRRGGLPKSDVKFR